MLKETRYLIGKLENSPGVAETITSGDFNVLIDQNTIDYVSTLDFDSGAISPSHRYSEGKQYLNNKTGTLSFSVPVTKNSYIGLREFNFIPIDEDWTNGNYQGYVATESSFLTSDSKFREVFTGDSANEWIVDGTATNEWATLTLPTPRKIYKLQLRSRLLETKNITQWKLEGSEDDVTYDVILNSTSTIPDTTTTIDVEPTQAYKYYKFTILAGDDYSGLSWFGMFEDAGYQNVPKYWKFLNACGMKQVTYTSGVGIEPDKENWNQTMTFQYTRQNPDGDVKQTTLVGCIGRSVDLVCDISDQMRLDFSFDGVLYSDTSGTTLDWGTMDTLTPIIYKNLDYTIQNIDTFYECGDNTGIIALPVSGVQDNVTTYTVSFYYKETSTSIARSVYYNGTNNIHIVFDGDYSKLTYVQNSGSNIKTIQTDVSSYLDEFHQYTYNIEQVGLDVNTKLYADDTKLYDLSLSGTWDSVEDLPLYIIQSSEQNCIGQFGNFMIARSVKTPQQMREGGYDVLYKFDSGNGYIREQNRTIDGYKKLTKLPLTNNNIWNETGDGDLISINTSYNIALNNNIFPIYREGKIAYYQIGKNTCRLDISPYVEDIDLLSIAENEQITKHDVVDDNGNFSVTIPRAQAMTPKETDKNGQFVEKTKFVILGNNYIVNGMGTDAQFQIFQGFR